MGNKQQKVDSNVNPNNQADDTGNDIQVRQKSDPPKKSAGCCGGCFGSKSQVNQREKIKYQSSVKNKTSYAHDTRKSSILVKSLPNAKVDEKLFTDKDKALLEIKMKRAEPYQILKDSDYFDSQINDKSDLQRLKKVYDSCEIANYQTPQTEKLQTVQIKTYLFDRNLTKIEA